MKRIVFLLVAVLAVAALVGCGDDGTTVICPECKTCEDCPGSAHFVSAFLIVVNVPLKVGRTSTANVGSGVGECSLGHPATFTIHRYALPGESWVVCDTTEVTIVPTAPGVLVIETLSECEGGDGYDPLHRTQTEAFDVTE